LISTRVRERKIGVDVSVTLDELRSIQVFVLGDVEQPGSFTVSSLSTVTNGLFVAGGITEQGSLRNVQLKRNGQTIAQLDLYDLLLKGDVSGDRRVQQGDVIFVPAVGTQVAVSGEVNRPAIFEVTPDETLDDLLDFASGFSGFAYTADVRLARTVDGVRRVSKSLSESELSQLSPISGDVVEVMSVVDRPDAAVELVGLVARPGFVEWTPGMQLSEIVRNQSDLLLPPEQVLVLVEPFAEADNKGIHVFRGSSLFAGGHVTLELNAKDRVSFVPMTQTSEERIAYYLSKDVEAQQTQQTQAGAPDSNESVLGLLNRDNRESMEVASGDPFVTLISQRAGLNANQSSDRTDPLLEERDRRSQTRLQLIQRGVIDPVDTERPFIDRRLFFDDLVARVQAGSKFGTPAPIVTIRGEVNEPGVYPLPQSGSIADVLLLAGGVKAEADLGAIELVQRSPDGFTVERILSDEIVKDQRVSRDSEIIVRKDRDQIALPAVTIAGFVQYPGTYRMAQGSTLSDLIERAGGVTGAGDIRSAIFSRKTLRDQERAQLARLRAETESQLAQQAIQGTALGQGANVSAVGASLELSRLLREVETTTAIGRLVIDLPRILAGQLEQNVILEDGDALVIPGIRQSVTVLGEVLYPTSHIFELGVTPDEYIARSGGTNRRADEGRAYIIRANGAVQPMTSGNFLTRTIQDGPVIEPGDTIVVPRDVDDVPALQLWTAVTQIVYQSAIAISAIGGLDF